MVENIRYGNKVVARIIGVEELDGPFKFFTEDKDHLQISRWNHPKGYVCKPHIHNRIPRTIDLVNEMIHVLEGELEVTFYTMEGKPFMQRILRKGDICHEMECGHGYKVLTEGTRVLEVKNGPFLGTARYDEERTLIDYKEEASPWDMDMK